MELEGAKSCFEYLQRAGLAIKVFVSDRHRGIAKWIKDHNPSVTPSLISGTLQREWPRNCSLLARRKDVK